MDFKDLLAYQKAFSLAMEIKNITDSFPKEEKYALTDQIRRSSRSVYANMAEAYRKRRNVNHFISKITDFDSENSETSVWLDFAFECKYVATQVHQDLILKSKEIGKLINYIFNNPDKFVCNLN